MPKRQKAVASTQQSHSSDRKWTDSVEIRERDE